MTEENLTSDKISPQLIKREIENYLGSTTVGKEQVTMLLKQGAQENNLFMIKESTYEKLANILELNLDEPKNLQEENLGRMLTSFKHCSMDNFGDSEMMNSLGVAANQVTELMKSRRTISERSNSIRTSSILEDGFMNNLHQKFASDLEPRSFKDLKIEEDSKESTEDTSTEIDYSSHKYLESKDSACHQTRTNFLIVMGMIGLSILCFITFAFVTYEAKKNVVIHITGWPLVVARGCALAILVFSAFLLIFVSYDLMTWIRGWAHKC